MSRYFWRTCCAIVTALVAGGCASLPLEQGRLNVESLVQSRTSVKAADAAQIEAWLAAPLTLERAQQISLLRSPVLQQHYARLGMTAADVFEAGRLHNPTLGLSWLLPLGAAEGSTVGASLMAPFTDLLLRNSRRRFAAAEHAALQEGIASAALDVLADTQRAWFSCVAANQRVAVRRSIADAAQLAADLAQKYLEAGNINALEMQIQRAEATQARMALHDARMQLADARAELQKMLGLSFAQSAWTVPELLPEVPRSELPAAQQLVARTLSQRLDISAARRHVQALGQKRDATRRYRMVGDWRGGAALEREADGVKRAGPALEIALPVFRQGQGVLARAEAELAAATASLVELETAAQAELIRQVSRMELAREQVKDYREGLIPQREAVVARITEQANYMLVDSFAVLQARQQQYAAYAGYVDAQLTYWNAHVDLLRAAGSQRGQEESR